MSILDVISDLSNKNLEAIPEEVFNMINLKMLYLENNCLTELPEDFFDKLQRLTWLDLRRNKLETLPVGIANHPVLETLLLQDNKFRTLPNELGLVPNLKVLQITGNPIVYPKVEVLEKGIPWILFFLKDQYTLKQATAARELEEEQEEIRNAEIKMSVSTKEPSAENTLKNKFHQNVLGSLSGASINVRRLSRTPVKKDRPHTVNTPTRAISRHHLANLNPLDLFVPKKFHQVTRKHSRIAVHSQLSIHKKVIDENPSDDIDQKQLSEIWLQHLKELLTEQENILQQEKNLNALSNWRMNKKMEIPRRQRKVTLDVPYDTNSEYNKLMSREDLTNQIDEMIKKNKKSQGAKKSINYSPEQIQKMINDVVDQMKVMEVNLRETHLTPRSEQDAAGKQIKNIVDLHKAILTLQTSNDNI